MASMGQRPFRKPDERGWQSAASIGSRIARRASWIMRSQRVALPRGRVLPARLGLCTRRTGWGTYVGRLKLWRSAVIGSSSGSLKRQRVSPSTPAVVLPGRASPVSAAQRRH
jgi:hypothetical protein